ncbi:MAG: CAP domain-containing protein [Deltaproteobacteria bacterium]|nr:CAP domain-containing protein [Deltaproteobacteria bacterium]
MNPRPSKALGRIGSTRVLPAPHLQTQTPSASWALLGALALVVAVPVSGCSGGGGDEDEVSGDDGTGGPGQGNGASGGAVGPGGNPPSGGAGAGGDGSSTAGGRPGGGAGSGGQTSAGGNTGGGVNGTGGNPGEGGAFGVGGPGGRFGGGGRGGGQSGTGGSPPGMGGSPPVQSEGCAVTKPSASGNEPGGAIPVCCTPGGTDKAMIDEVFSLLNAHRMANGRSALAYDTKLELAMQGHCKHMAQHSFFDHSAPEGSVSRFTDRATACGASAAGENIAYNQRSASQVMTSWKNSSGHNMNMLSTGYKRVGIGLYQWRWGQIFGR